MPAPIDPDTKATDATGGAPTPDSGETPARPRYDQPIQGDTFEVLRHYQKVTLPPHARLKLLSAQLPQAPPDQLLDTFPPNGGMRAPIAPAPKSPHAVADDSREQDTKKLPRLKRRRQLRTTVIVAVGLGLAPIAAAVVITWQPDARDPVRSTTSPANAPAVTPAPAVPGAASTKAPPAQINLPPSIDDSPPTAVSADSKAEKPSKEPHGRALPKAPKAPTSPATPPALVNPNVSNPPAPAASVKHPPGFNPDRPLWGDD